MIEIIADIIIESQHEMKFLFLTPENVTFTLISKFLESSESNVEVTYLYLSL